MTTEAAEGPEQPALMAERRGQYPQGEAGEAASITAVKEYAHEEPADVTGSFVLHEPPWYGTVCPVVWEDGGSNPASYPMREDGSPHDVEVQAQLTNALPFDLVLPLVFAGAAEENVDYQVAGDKRIVIPKNNLSGIVTLSITPLVDVLDEGFELIEIRAASVPGISTFAVVLDPGLGFSSFESWEGWSGYPRQLNPTVFTASPFTDAADNVWTSSVAKIMNRDEKEVRTGRQSLALSYGPSSRQGVVLDPAGADGVGVVSFYVKRFSDDTRSINLKVEYRVGQNGAWTQVFSQDYSGSDIPSSFTEVRVPINQAGDVQLQFSVAGVKGFLIDDVSVTSHK